MLEDSGKHSGSVRSASTTSFLIRGSSISTMARILAVASGFGAQLVLARMLDPAALGAFFLTQSVVLVVASTAQLGLPRVIVRELGHLTGSEQWSRARTFAARSVLYSASGVAVASVVYGFGLGQFLSTAVFGSSRMEATAALAALWILGVGLQNLLAEGLRGTHAVGWASILGGTLASSMTFLLLGTFLFTGWTLDLSQVLLIVSLGSIVSACLAAILLCRRFPCTQSTAEAPTSRVILGQALAMLVLESATAAVAQSDLWIVGTTLTEEQTAVYGAAKRLIILVSIPLMMVSTVVSPLIADLYKRNESARMERVLRGTSSVAGIPAIAMLLVFVGFSQPILGATFGEFYEAGAITLAVLSLERLVFVWTGPCGTLLMMSGKDRVMLQVVIAGGLLQVMTTWFGARLGGMEGAATGLLVGSSVRMVAMWEAARRTSGVRTDLSFVLARQGLSLVYRAATRALKD